MSDQPHNTQFHSIYMGMVIQNNDPTRKGRVKVYIPEVSPTIYSGWNSLEGVTLRFKSIGKNILSDLTPIDEKGALDNLAPIIEDLKMILPWSYVVMPIIGDTTPANYDATSITSTISDGKITRNSDREDYKEGDELKEDQDGELNADKNSEKPGHVYERSSTALSDPFSSPQSIGANIANPNGTAYEGTSHSNKAKGSFSIPGVGSIVWVQFRNGNPQFPVIVGAAYGQDDYKEIYEIDKEGDERLGGIDYPGDIGNKRYPELGDIPEGKYKLRSKWSVNQRGSTLEIINTEGRESFKATHYSGSFFEMNNRGSTSLTIGNSQDLTRGHSWSSVYGTRNIFTSIDEDNIVLGDKYNKVGNWQKHELMDQWKVALEPLQYAKSLFHIQRAANGFATGNIDYNGNFGGHIQLKKGTHAQHPAMSHSDITTTNDAPVIRDGKCTSTLDEIEEKLTHTLKDEQESPTIASFPGIRAGADVGPEIGNLFPLSSSSVNGEFVDEPIKEDIEKIKREVQKSLIPIESAMDKGGDEQNIISKNQTNIIGGSYNDFPSIRQDSIGKQLWNSVVMDQTGVFPSMVPGILLEPIPVEKLPGGTKTDTICDGWDVDVGAGGVSIKTVGMMSLSSTIFNIGADQINIGTRTDFNVSADAVNISGRVVELHNKAGGQIYVNGSLGVSKNAIIKGGAAINGELYCQHITAPAELNKTWKTEVYGKFNTTKARTLAIGEVEHIASDGSKSWLTVYALPDDDLIRNYEHSHDYINAPMRLMKSNELVRKQAIADGINPGHNVAPMAALPLNHQRKSIISGVQGARRSLQAPNPSAETPLG